MKKIFFTCISVLFFTLSSQAQSWSELGAGSHALYAASRYEIYNICIDPFENVYAVAYDTSYYGPYVYKWDGFSWSKLDSQNVQPFNGQIDALCSDANGNIYVSGEFTNSDTTVFNGGHAYVAKWDGSTWQEVGTGNSALNANGEIISICFDKFGNLYAAGTFEDNTGKSYVAKWNGNNWTELGTGTNALNPNSYLTTVCVDTNGNVYTAGAFTDGVNVTTGNLSVAKWDGTSWSELGNGVCAQWDTMDNSIFSLIADPQGNIYAGGILHYGNGGTNQYYGVSRWNGTSWDILNYGSNVDQFCVDPMGNVYAPLLDTITGLGYIGKWDGSNWQELGTGNNAMNCNGDILTVASDVHGNIYAAGSFTDTTLAYAIDTANIGNHGPPYYAHPCYVAKYLNPTANINSVNTVSNVAVYPNPAKDELNITTQATGMSYRLMSITGVSLTSGMLQQGNNSVSLNGFASGIYMLEMKASSGQESVERVVKE